MPRILVIDDDDQIRIMLRWILEREGYEVIDAPDGGVGTALYKANPTDLVITDIFMPNKGGIDAMMDLLDVFPRLKIIAISGGGSVNAEQVLRMAKSLGAQQVFTKPVNIKDLLQTVSGLLHTVQQ
jgi:CheY-like chemotaxis protein